MAENFAEGTVELKAIGVDQIETAMNKAAAAAKKTADEIGSVEKALKKQIAQFGMNSKEIQVWELRAKGATTGQINSIMALTAQYEKLQAKQKQQQEAVAAMGRTKAAVEEVTSALKKQMATYGMSADQIAVWELKSKGATAAQIIEVRKLQKEYAALQAAQAKRQQDATDKQTASSESAAKLKATQAAVDGVTESLKKQTATFKMSADEIVLWELKQKGATDQQIASVKKLQAEYNRLQEVQRRQTADAGVKPVQSGGMFGSLKNLAGASSQITGVIGGLAALGGIKMAADAIANLAKQTTDLRLQYERGEISANDFSDGVARNIPIFGSLYSAVTDGSRALQDFAAATLRGIPGNEKLAAAIESGATAAARAKHEMEKLAAVYEMVDKLRTESLQGRDYSSFAKQELVRAEADKERAGIDAQLPEGGRTSTVRGWLWNTTQTKPLSKAEQQARRDALTAIAQREQEKLAEVWKDADQAGQMQGAESGDDRAARKRQELLDTIEATSNALEEQVKLWGLVGRARDRAMLARQGASELDLAAFDRNSAALEVLENRKKSREVMGGIGSTAAMIGKQLANDGKGIARDARQEMADLKMRQQAQTQFLSASGLADQMQVAIGNAANEQEALKAAKEARDAVKKQADCVEGKELRVKVTSMPAAPAVFG